MKIFLYIYKAVIFLAAVIFAFAFVIFLVIMSIKPNPKNTFHQYELKSKIDKSKSEYLLQKNLSEQGKWPDYYKNIHKKNADSIANYLDSLIFAYNKYNNLPPLPKKIKHINEHDR